MIILCWFAFEVGLSLIHDRKTFFLAAYARISYNLKTTACTDSDLVLFSQLLIGCSVLCGFTSRREEKMFALFPLSSASLYSHQC